MPSNSSSSTCSGLLISHSLLSTLAQRSCESSNPRFGVLIERLGFIAGLLAKAAGLLMLRCLPSPNSGSASRFLEGISNSDGMPPISTSWLNFRFFIPRAVCVNSFSSFSSGGDDARVFRTGAILPENDPVGVGGDAASSSSNSGDDKSTSGDGDSSLLCSASASSDLEAALDKEGEIMTRCGKVFAKGSGIGWCW